MEALCRLHGLLHNVSHGRPTWIPVSSAVRQFDAGGSSPKVDGAQYSSPPEQCIINS